jgi:hypothetical protein
MPRLFSVLPPLLLSATLLAIAGCNSGATVQPAIALARVRTAPAVVGPAAPSIRTNGLLAMKTRSACRSKWAASFVACQ